MRRPAVGGDTAGLTAPPHTDFAGRHSHFQAIWPFFDLGVTNKTFLKSTVFGELKCVCESFQSFPITNQDLMDDWRSLVFFFFFLKALKRNHDVLKQVKNIKVKPEV